LRRAIDVLSRVKRCCVGSAGRSGEGGVAATLAVNRCELRGWRRGGMGLSVGFILRMPIRILLLLVLLCLGHGRRVLCLAEVLFFLHLAAPRGLLHGRAWPRLPTTSIVLRARRRCRRRRECESSCCSSALGVRDDPVGRRHCCTRASSCSCSSRQAEVSLARKEGGLMEGKGDDGVHWLSTLLCTTTACARV
jgi:hypothetical protein